VRLLLLKVVEDEAVTKMRDKKKKKIEVLLRVVEQRSSCGVKKKRRAVVAETWLRVYIYLWVGICRFHDSRNRRVQRFQNNPRWPSTSTEKRGTQGKKRSTGYVRSKKK